MAPMAFARETERLVWERTRRLLREFISRAHHVGRNDPLARASLALTLRIANGFESLYTLRSHSSHAWDVDGVCILRSMYDALLQLLYVAVESCNPSLARRYLDFEWIERWHSIRRIQESPTVFAKSLMESPDREFGEKRVSQMVEETRSQFIDAKGKLSKNWYCGDLRQVAAAVGYEQEYELFQQDSSKSVHSSSAPLQRGPIIRRDRIDAFASAFSLRAVGVLSRVYGLRLNPDDQEAVEYASGNLYDTRLPKKSLSP